MTNVPAHADVSVRKEINTTSATSAASVLAMVVDALEDSWCQVSLEAYIAICARIASSWKAM